MIIAIVGYSYSGKGQIARDLVYHTDGKFHRLKPYTTRKGGVYQRSCYMQKDERDKLPDDSIYNVTFDDFGNEYFIKKSQLVSEGDKIYVVDDPDALLGLEGLGVPYVIVYVNCPRNEIIAKAEAEHEILKAVKSRYGVVHDRMEAFRCSENYNLYIDTARISPSDRTEAIMSFVVEMNKWVAKGATGHMPFISGAKSRAESVVICKSVVIEDEIVEEPAQAPVSASRLSLWGRLRKVVGWR